MLARRYRLRDRHSVGRVYKRGKTVRAGALSLRTAANDKDVSRMTVVISKKVAKSAVARNRIRRRISEALRRRWSAIKPGYDLVLSVYEPTLKTLPQAELENLLDQLLSKSGLRG